MKKYSDPQAEPDLPVLADNLFHTPKTICHCIQLGDALGKKIDPLLSSPTQSYLQSYRKGSKQILRVAHIQQNDLITIQTATKKALRRKTTLRNYIVGKGAV